MKRLLLPLIPIALAACASTSADKPKETAQNAAGGDVICEREMPTGSSFPTKVCRTAAQREADRREVEATSEGMRRGAAAAQGKGGG